MGQTISMTLVNKLMKKWDQKIVAQTVKEKFSAPLGI